MREEGGEGNDLKGRQILSLKACKDLCTATSSCNSIAWNSKDDACWIKDKSDACTDTPCNWNSADSADDWHWYWLACAGALL